MVNLSDKIIALIENARSKVAFYANSAMVCTYFEIGKSIVEEFQKGELRAEYGLGLMKKLSADLSQKGLKGFSVQNLERMRNFYNIYSISSSELRNSILFQNSSNELRISDNNETTIKILPISWSHYLFLMRIKTENENPTIGIILCKDKKQSIVEITLPQNNKQIFASKYQTIIPSKEDFQHLLNDYE